MLLLLYLVVTILSPASYGELIGDGGVRGEGKCASSVTLYKGEEMIKITEEVRELEESMKVDRAVMVGCGGCFRLYEKKNGRGKSYFVNKNGEHSSLNIRKVRSVHRVSCGNMAMPMWVVILVVVVVLVVVGVATVVGVRKCRGGRYDSVNTA